MPYLVAGGQPAEAPEGQEPQGQEGHAGGIDVNGRPIVVHHADVVNNYNAPVTINNYLAAAPVVDASENDGTGSGAPYQTPPTNAKCDEKVLHSFPTCAGEIAADEAATTPSVGFEFPWVQLEPADGTGVH